MEMEKNELQILCLEVGFPRFIGQSTCCPLVMAFERRCTVGFLYWIRPIVDLWTGTHRRGKVDGVRYPLLWLNLGSSLSDYCYIRWI